MVEEARQPKREHHGFVGIDKIHKANAEYGSRSSPSGEPPRAIFGEVTLILPSSDEAPLVGVPCAKVGFAEQKSEGETK